MKKLTILFFILLMTQNVHANILTSPAQHKYFKGNNHFDNQEYNEAITIFKEFIEENPRSTLLIPAQLNLGMSYFYIEDCLSAYKTLSSIRLKDGSIKEYIDKVMADCKEEIPDEIAKLETPSTTKDSKPRATSGNITIKIIDSYLDNFGNLNLAGRTDKPSTVTINGVAAQKTKNNTFNAAIKWRRGQRIVINALDTKGNAGEIDHYPDSEPPDEPRRLYVASQSSNSMEIRWDENEEKDIKGYRLFYRRKGASTIEVNEIITDTDYEIVGLSKFVDGGNRTFEFFIKAVDKMDNESDPSDILEAELPL